MMRRRADDFASRATSAARCWIARLSGPPTLRCGVGRSGAAQRVLGRGPVARARSADRRTL